ncbi:hypothetical protein EJB05_47129, partial [Eragrostis curvula]
MVVALAMVDSMEEVLVGVAFAPIPTFNVADLSPFFGSEESRTTPFQEGEDDEDIPVIHNEDAFVDMPLVTPGTITPCPTPVSHEATRVGPITRSRAKKIQQEVNPFLASHTLNIDENYVLPKSRTLLLLRFTHEDTSMGNMDDANGYTEDIKNVAQDKHGYKLLTQGYVTEESTCHPSLYQSVTNNCTKYTCLER